MVLSAGRIVSLHTHIHADKEILEVQADARTISRCYLLIELVELEHTTRLILIPKSNIYFEFREMALTSVSLSCLQKTKISGKRA